MNCVIFIAENFSIKYLGLPLLKIFAPRWKRLAPVDRTIRKSNEMYEYLYYANAQPAR